MTIFDDLRARRKSSMVFRLWLLLCGKETDDAHFYVVLLYFIVTAHFTSKVLEGKVVLYVKVGPDVW